MGSLSPTSSEFYSFGFANVFGFCLTQATGFFLSVYVAVMFLSKSPFFVWGGVVGGSLKLHILRSSQKMKWCPPAIVAIVKEFPSLLFRLRRPCPVEDPSHRIITKTKFLNTDSTIALRRFL